jgi:hypothetical protein
MSALDILFLYNEKEEDVEPVVERINNMRYQTFFWRNDVPIGDVASGAEEDMLDSVGAVVVFLGNYGWGPNHLRLTEIAKEKEKKIIPVLMAEVSSSEMEKAGNLFVVQRYVDFTEGYSKNFGKLIQAIGPRSKVTAPSAFDGFMESYFKGNDESRSELLSSVHRFRKDQLKSLAARVFTELEYFPLEFEDISVTDQEHEERTSLRSWLISLLIWTDPHSQKSRSLLMRHLDYDTEPDGNIRFWTLAGLYQQKVEYLHEAAKAAFSGDTDAVSALASLIVHFNRELISELRILLKGNDTGLRDMVLKVLRIFPVPELFEDILDLLPNKELRYDTLYAVANPELKDHSGIIVMIYSSSQMLEFIHSLWGKTANIHIRNFSSILLAYPKEETDRALLTFRPGHDAFLREVRKGIGLSSRGESVEVIKTAGYISDQSGSDYDLLDIRKDVRMLTSLMLSNKIDPPLAIGLFGNWGTGKSFFMDSLEQYCDELISDFAEREKAPIHTDVVQIRFNAWNYSDSNLWASLVHHIFDDLSRFVTPPQTEKEKIEEFSTDIALKEDLVQAAKKGLQKESEALSEKQANLTILEEGRLNRPIQFEEINLDDYWSVLNEEQKAAAKKFMEDMGISSLHTSLVNMQEVVAEGKRVRGRFFGLISWITDKKNRWLKIGILSAIFIIVPLCGYFLRTYWPNTLGELSAILFQIAAFVSAIALYARKGLKYVNKALSIVEATTVAISDVFEKLRAEPSEAEVFLKEDIDRLIISRELAASALISAEEDLQQGLKAKVEFEKEISLGYFVAERSLSVDYGKHLGLVTTIRKDFKVLIEKLAGSQQEIHGKKVTRIILYIDDLDRCQPEKVFEVLQAVHLLLAYKLFVVVVGVDPDWMTSSLESTYSQFSEIRKQGKHATPQSFIEKIFQIPFNLKPMSGAGFPGLMEGLFNPVEKALTTVVNKETGPTDETSSASESSPARSTATKAVILGTGVSGQAISSGGSNPKIVSADDLPESDKNDLTERAAAVLEQSLDVREWESAFAGTLFPFIKTPRSAKRFVNIYRLLKVGVDIGEIAEFEGVSYQPGLFQLPMLLLSIVVGSPEYSGEILGQFFRGAKKKESITQTLDQMAVSEYVNPGISALGKEIYVIAERQWFPDSPELLIRWIPEVARFSFQPIRLE